MPAAKQNGGAEMTEETKPTNEVGATGSVRVHAGVRPCPFCGETDVDVYEGSTFRWRYAGCGMCGAQAGEIRCQTMGEGTKEEWEAAARIRAIEEWNQRA